MEKRHRTFAAITAVSLSLVAMVPALAASDYLLELESVEGEVTTKTSLELASWSFGASNPTSVGSSGMTSGRRQHEPIRLAVPQPENGSVTVQTAREAGSGMASGRMACTAGRHFPKATLLRGSQRWAMTDVILSSCNGDAMTLSYRSIAGWDLKANKKI